MSLVDNHELRPVLGFCQDDVVLLRDDDDARFHYGFKEILLDRKDKGIHDCSDVNV